MLIGNTRFRFLSLTVLLFASLACRAATRLVIPDTPTPLPTATLTSTPSPTPLPTFTPTVVFEAACSGELAQMLNSVSSNVILPSKRSEELFKNGDSIFLITYEVTNDKISGPQIEPVPEELEDERSDRARHEAIWDYFAAIIPPQEREPISEFSIFTDGRSNHLAAVSPLFSDPKQWALQVDILDAENHYDLTYSLVHEQGHLLTLNAEQVPPSTAIFKFPENKTVYKQEVAACPQYFTGEGCSQPDSYINQFFTRFWPYLYPEWQQIDLEEDEDTQATMLVEFYEVYQDQFLSNYAPTSPVEDIAESWTYFILSPMPELNSIADEKILFFYEYAELVELRTQILKNICTELPK
jgi:hypothetical protein